MWLIPTFSPQGDGNAHLEDIQWVQVDIVDPYLFPARGRKLYPIEGKARQIQPLIPTFSPQGDGNFTPLRARQDRFNR